MIPIDEIVHFDVILRDPDTREPSDADSTPTYDVFEESTDTPILADQNFTKRTSLTGHYRASFTASAANGFEVGKWYSVVASATVNGYSDKDVVLCFRCAPAESQAGYPKVDAQYVDGLAPDDSQDIAAAILEKATEDFEGTAPPNSLGGAVIRATHRITPAVGDPNTLEVSNAADDDVLYEIPITTDPDLEPIESIGPATTP